MWKKMKEKKIAVFTPKKIELLQMKTDQMLESISNKKPNLLYWNLINGRRQRQWSEFRYFLTSFDSSSFGIAIFVVFVFLSSSSDCVFVVYNVALCFLTSFRIWVLVCVIIFAKQWDYSDFGHFFLSPPIVYIYFLYFFFSPNLPLSLYLSFHMHIYVYNTLLLSIFYLFDLHHLTHHQGTSLYWFCFHSPFDSVKQLCEEKIKKNEKLCVWKRIDCFGRRLFH